MYFPVSSHGIQHAALNLVAPGVGAGSMDTVCMVVLQGLAQAAWTLCVWLFSRGWRRQRGHCVYGCSMTTVLLVLVNEASVRHCGGAIILM